MRAKENLLFYPCAVTVYLFRISQSLDVLQLGLLSVSMVSGLIVSAQMHS